MLIKLTGGTVYDPIQGIDGEVRDLYVGGERLVAAPANGGRPDHEYDLRGMVVMAGAIDMHTHIGGGKVNLARAMLPEEQRKHVVARTDLLRSGSDSIIPSTLTTGYRYAEMGYTACFEPAMLMVNSRQAHMEMADTPMVDTGGYVMLGNDDFYLRLLAEKAEQQLINDYVAWALTNSQAIGIKTVNPGGISAFKFNQRSLDVDERSRHYEITPRAIVQTLSRALAELGVPHPLHIHCSNLGTPGNVKSTLATMDAAEGRRVHLTHIQFHSYGTEGDRKFSSAAAEIAEAINARPNVSVDVGQIMFGQTVTVSGDTMRQYANHSHASPKKWTTMDIECEAGCGIVPLKYRDQAFVNGLQWAIGLEIFLMVQDPWRVFLTTDHPNGAPFTSYPHLIRLLMDKGFRREQLARINPDAAAASTLGSLDREYSLYEMAIMTRAGPARILGLQDRGSLQAGAVADVVAYRLASDYETMFAKPAFVFKGGELLVRDGQILKVVGGRTHVVKPEFDRGIERRLADYFSEYYTIRLQNFKIGDAEMAELIGSPIVEHQCLRRQDA